MDELAEIKAMIETFRETLTFLVEQNLGHYPATPIPLRKGDKISIKRLTSEFGVNFTNRFIPTFIPTFI